MEELRLVGPRLRDARTARGWTLADLAGRAGMSVSTLSRLESGKRQASLELLLPLTKQLAVQGNLWKGENLDTYFGGVGQGVNMALGREIEAQGGWAQLLYDPTDKLSFGLGYAVDDPKDEDVAEGKPSKNEQIFGNVAYKFTAAVTGLAEYAHMTTDYLGRDDAENDRVQVSMKYAF